VSPLARIRVAKRAALRRRYGYAALRILRRGVRQALQLHRQRQISPLPYSTSTDEITAAYLDAIRRLRKTWPKLNPNDPRAEVENRAG
jgi:hypothetical protein